MLIFLEKVAGSTFVALHTVSYTCIQSHPDITCQCICRCAWSGSWIVSFEALHDGEGCNRGVAAIYIERQATWGHLECGDCTYPSILHIKTITISCCSTSANTQVTFHHKLDREVYPFLVGFAKIVWLACCGGFCWNGEVHKVDPLLTGEERGHYCHCFLGGVQKSFISPCEVTLFANKMFGFFPRGKVSSSEKQITLAACFLCVTVKIQLFQTS